MRKEINDFLKDQPDDEHSVAVREVYSEVFSSREGLTLPQISQVARYDKGSVGLERLFGKLDGQHTFYITHAIRILEENNFIIFDKKTGAYKTNR